MDQHETFAFTDITEIRPADAPDAEAPGGAEKAQAPALEKPRRSAKSRTRDGGGHTGTDARNGSASPENQDPGRPGGDDGRIAADNLSCLAVVTDAAAPRKGRQKAGDGQKRRDAHGVEAVPDLRFSDPSVAQLVQLHRMRRRWLKARNALILQSKAFGRSLCGGDKEAGSAMFERIIAGEMRDEDETLAIALVPFIPAIERFDAELKTIEKTLVKAAKRLPIAPWVETVKGLGWLSVASIVGEAGDLSKYPSVSGVWKRLGLAVIDGERQRKVADADKALLHAYSPERRSVVWNVGNGVIGGMGLGKRPMVGEDVSLRTDWTEYERLFVERLRIEAEKNPEHRRPDTKAGKESFSRHAAARAKRYVEKRMIKHMVLAWRDAVGLAATPWPVVGCHMTGEVRHASAPDHEFLQAAE